MGRLSFRRDHALLSLLRMVAVFLIPFLVAIAGLALLTRLPTAILWLGIIASITYLYIRFNTTHNEHPEYDDHPPLETYLHGLESYLKLLQRQNEHPQTEP